MAEQSPGSSGETPGEKGHETLNRWKYQRLQYSWGSEVGKGLGLTSPFVFRKNGEEVKLPLGVKFFETIAEDINKLGNEGWECFGFSSSWPSSGGPVEVYLFKKCISPQST